jgi:DNA-directed RNA polymerase specialized sigma24 family protein
MGTNHVAPGTAQEVQPNEPLSIEAVAAFEASDEAMRVERLADLRIVESLRRVDFNPMSWEWRTFEAALIEYGYTVLVTWGVTGALAGHAARHGGVSRRRVPTDLRLNEDDARALATEILIVAIEKFRTKSLPRWSPAGGASLKTFFVGRCLMELADVYSAWRRREECGDGLDPAQVDEWRYGPSVAEQAEARVLTDQLLDGDPDLRTAFELQTAGYELEEIARRLGTTGGRLKSRMYRFRKRIGGKKEGIDG